MTEIWNLSTLCRCCHSDGCFKSLNQPYQTEQDLEIYETMLQTTLGIKISQPPAPVEASYTICEGCISKLRDASQFRQQVLACERKFQVYCTNEQFFNSSTEIVKGEVEPISTEYDNNNIDFDHSSYQNDILVHDGSDMKIKKEITIEVDITHPIKQLDEDKKVIKRNNIKIEVEPINYKKKINIKRKNLKKKPTEPKCHEEVTQKKTLAKKYSCDICQKEFTYNAYLEVHKKIHNGEKTFICLLCNTLHLNNKELAKHISITHIVNNKYPCNVCNKIFDKVKLLIKHIKTHFKEKFQCTQCQKEFKFKKGLKEHMKIHSGEKKYNCEVCNKAFTHSQNLKSHTYIHTGEKPYVCDVCGRRFYQRTQLKRHIFIIHAGLKPYACNVCNVGA